MLRVKTQPISTGAAAVYRYNKKAAEAFTAVDRWGEPYALHRVVGTGDNKRLLLPRAACPLGKIDTRVDGLEHQLVSNVIPRDSEQARVIDESSGLLLTGKSHIIQAKPGFGKTVCTTQLIANVGRKTLIVVTKEDVRDQWIEALGKFLNLKENDIGLIQGDKTLHKNRAVSIAMIQSISKIDKYPSSMWRTFGMVVWDEVHRLGAEQFSNTAWLFPAKLRLGLSATPKRTDGKQKLYFAHIGPVAVISTQVQMVPKVKLVDTGWKVPLSRRYNKKKKKMAWVQYPHVPGKIAGLVKLMAQDKERNRMLVNAVVQAFNHGRKTIVFSSSRDHLDLLFDLTFMRGVVEKDMSFYVGGLKKQERKLAATKRILFATYQFCSEATDIPDLDTAIFASPMSQVEQIAGRIMRHLPGKKVPVIVDFQDMDSWVLARYAMTRKQYYESINAKVVKVK